MGLIRRAKLTLTYQGKDITRALGDWVESVSVIDSFDEADTLEIRLADPDDRWLGAWWPEEGAKLRAGLELTDWPSEGKTQRVDLGTFTIDEIEAEGPPGQVTIKGVSAPVDKAIQRERRSASWRGVTLRHIAAEIATRHGLELYYSADENPRFDLLAQNNESDLYFLKRRARENGLSLKVADGKLILFEGRKLDARPAAATLARGAMEETRYRFRSNVHKVFKACRVTYWDHDEKRIVSQTYAPPDAPTAGHVLEINERVGNHAEAWRRAKNRLRHKNKHTATGELEMIGRPGLAAGLNVDLTGFGQLDGKYAIDKARHTLSKREGYRLALNVRKVLPF